jgi:hypothetical protein
LALAAVAIATAGILARADSGKPKFYRDDPILVAPETQDASGVSVWKIDLFYDLMLNSFTQKGLPPGSRSQNVNTIDEVPDSSWFTNRILARPMSVEELVRGPVEHPGPAPGEFTIIGQKREGDAPGFTMRDTAGVTWFVEFDPPSNPQAATAAAVIANRIFWALGYNQAEYVIGSVSREQLRIGKDVTYKAPSGRVRPMKIHDIDRALEKAARNPDGTYRMFASRLVPGKILGGFKYYGTRSDDPNDIVPHEQRRELRALQVFGAWTNLVDVKALNTMDTLITENGKSRVRHYLLDVGSTFGIGANGPRDWTDGYEYFYEGDKMRKRLLSLGFYLQPWQTVKYTENKAIGRFEGDEFDPPEWRSRIPAAALLQARDDDAFWAARRVMAFSDEMIRAVVKVGQYSYPAAEKLLVDVLIKRRNKIGQVYMTRINPLVDFALDSTGVLTFENAAVHAGVAAAVPAYTASWFVLNNSTGTYSPIGSETRGMSSRRIAAPAGLPQAPGSYVAADVRAVDSGHPAWAMPVRATFLRTQGGWKLIGVERTLADTPGAAAPASSQTPSVAGR